MRRKSGGSRWKIIAPFLSPLRNIRALQLDKRICEGRLQSVCAGLVFTLPVQTSADDQRALRAAFELLHILWTLDREAWRRAVGSGIGVRFPGPLTLLDPQQMPHIIVSVKHDKFPWQILSSERWAELLKPRATFSTEATTARERLLKAYGIHNGVLDVPKIPLGLQFLVFGMATSVVEAYLSNVVTMAESIQQSLCRDARSALQLVALDLEIAPYEMTSRLANQVARLHALGVPFRELTLRLTPAAECDRLITTLFNTQHVQSPEEMTVETFVIDKADLTEFTSTCTALETTKAVKNVRLQNVFTFDTPSERYSKWQSLTRVLFAPASRTSIKHVSIQQFELKRVDMEAVQAELQLSQSEIPGDHALETLAISSEASLVETIQTIPLLLALIGTNLRCLSIYAWVGTLTTASVRDILAACRHLEFLDLSSVELDSFDVFLDAYDRHGCRIRSLALHEVQVASEHVTAFAHTLCDARHESTRVLRELSLNCVGDDNTMDEANVPAFLQVLQRNRTLRYLELRMEEPLLSMYRGRFKSHNQENGVKTYTFSVQNIQNWVQNIHVISVHDI